MKVRNSLLYYSILHTLYAITVWTRLYMHLCYNTTCIKSLSIWVSRDGHTEKHRHNYRRYLKFYLLVEQCKSALKCFHNFNICRCALSASDSIHKQINWAYNAFSCFPSSLLNFAHVAFEFWICIIGLAVESSRLQNPPESRKMTTSLELDPHPEVRWLETRKQRPKKNSQRRRIKNGETYLEYLE